MGQGSMSSTRGACSHGSKGQPAITHVLRPVRLKDLDRPKTLLISPESPSYILTHNARSAVDTSRPCLHGVPEGLSLAHSRSGNTSYTYTLRCPGQAKGTLLCCGIQPASPIVAAAGKRWQYQPDYDGGKKSQDPTGRTEWLRGSVVGGEKRHQNTRRTIGIGDTTVPLYGRTAVWDISSRGGWRKRSQLPNFSSAWRDTSRVLTQIPSLETVFSTLATG